MTESPLSPPPRDSPRPSKIIAVHVAYRSRAMERGSLPPWPSYFLKPPNTLARSGDPVLRPPGCDLLAFEGEVALVIGRTATRVSASTAWEHVAYVTAANDFGVYDLRYADKGSNVRSKGIDGYTPLGPEFLDASRLDPDEITLRTWVNGNLRQEARSGDDLLFGFADIVADISRLTTLEPGDVVLTGTPTGSTVVRPGDSVEVEVTAGGLSSGRLVSPIADASYDLTAPGALPRADDAQRAAAFGAASSSAERPTPAVHRGVEGGCPPSESTVPAPEDIISAISAVSTATLAAQLKKRGYDSVTLDRLRVTNPELTMAGFARTVRYVPFREDLFKERGGGFNAQKQAIEQVRPGEILVIEARGDPTAGTVGDILALRAAVRGARGIVTDGAIRDSLTLSEMDIPVYYSAAHPAVLGRRHVPWETNVTVACAGVTIQPGDVIAGDADGVIVIPRDIALEVAEASAEQERQERFITERVADGESVDGLYPLGPKWRPAYEKWLKENP
jgi:regulator of RNase E activity RraA/2-keto-4-pentenoate hydratase/2-oxohepta-3-ene-1,7-dioic acid hydratase in catechol pathway